MGFSIGSTIAPNTRSVPQPSIRAASSSSRGTEPEAAKRLSEKRMRNVSKDPCRNLFQAAPLVGYSNPYYFISSYKRYFQQEKEDLT